MKSFLIMHTTSTELHNTGFGSVAVHSITMATLLDTIAVL